jgi:hypothetical protein
MHNLPDEAGPHASSYTGPERRRYPRVSPADEVTVTVSMVTDTELLDISASGALLSTTARLLVGERAHLRVLLAREPFNAWVQVRRVQAGTMIGTESRHRLGVTFSGLDDTSRRTLQRFMGDDTRT